MVITPIILSGGSGSRLWPLSTHECPKQFLTLMGEKTMFQQTLLRLEGLEIAAPIISCNEAHRFLIAQQLSDICCAKPTIILEPISKNTAPAIASACYAAMERDKDPIVIILPSDHIIKDVSAFQKALKIAMHHAQNGALVTFGIVPTFPATGYGYIKTHGNEKDGACTLEKFIEKPDVAYAQRYFASGNYSWNSGMFVFKASVFLEELRMQEPAMCQIVHSAFEHAIVDSDFIRLDKSIFEQVESNSIDYAVMEKTSKGKVVKLNAGWDDVGSWSAIWNIQKKDNVGNVITGAPIIFDTTNSYIYTPNCTVGVIGLDGVVIVASNDSILIAAKDSVQYVKKIVEELEKRI